MGIEELREALGESWAHTGERAHSADGEIEIDFARPEGVLIWFRDPTITDPNQDPYMIGISRDGQLRPVGWVVRRFPSLDAAKEVARLYQKERYPNFLKAREEQNGTS